MAISFKAIKVGSEWDRPSLAKLWGYKSFHAIARGAVTPRGDNKIILFITEEKQSSSTQYEDTLQGNTLKIQGENNHAADNRLINASVTGDEIHVFYRERHHSSFTYHGQAKLIKHKVLSGEPSRFEFRLES